DWSHASAGRWLGTKKGKQDSGYVVPLTPAVQIAQDSPSFILEHRVPFLRRIHPLWTGRMSKTADQYYQGLGRRIRAHRLMRGVSQETLGQQLGVTFQQIQKYENGANRVSAGRLLQIASFLKIDPAALLVDGEAQAKST